MTNESLSSRLSPLASSKPLKWLVSGGCGFIGTSLIRHLVAEGGHAIRVLDNLSVGTRDDLARVCDYKELDTSLSSRLSSHSSEALDPSLSSFLFPLSSQPPVQLVVGDILDEELALKVTKEVDVIVHLAANTGVAPSVEDPRKDCVTNVIGTLNYLEGARYNSVKRFVFASSGAPLGEQEPPLHEEMAPHPVSPYGASKLAGEGYCSAYYRTFGVETVALRFGNVYGPGSGHKNSVVAKFIRQSMAGETLEIYGDGKQTRDFIYIDDLIQAIRLAATVGGIGGEVFQIATNAETTIGELAEKLIPMIREAGMRDLEVRNTEPRQGDVLRNFSDTTKARNMLNWKNTVQLEEGLQRTLEWFLRESA